MKVTTHFWAKCSLILTLLVILAGSVVRVTQSGMGCPDWPKCFGYYVPPTEADHVRFHAQKAYKKGMMVIQNDTLWRATGNFTSNHVFDRNNWEKYPKHNYSKFVVYQTWVEYINRLLGALLGLFILALCISAFRKFSADKATALWSAAVLLLTLFQAWLGKLVVDGNLIPQSISIHMIAAFAILWLLTLIYSRSINQENKANPSTSRINWLALTTAIIVLIQTLIGTQVREQVDVIATAYNHGSRELWINEISTVLTLHKAFSLLVVAISVLLLFELKTSKQPSARFFRRALLSVVGFECMAGIIMVQVSIPAIAQAVHLLGASLLFYLCSRIYFYRFGELSSSNETI
jgi:cytochrome c oxidase assembly protein subunit 15